MMMETINLKEENAKTIIKKEGLELEYNIVIDHLSKENDNNVSAADMNYITIRKENLCPLISRLTGDYFYEAKINIFSSETANDIANIMNENIDLIRETLHNQKLEIHTYSINW